MPLDAHAIGRGLGPALQGARTHAGYSLRAAARLAGTSATALSLLERGQQRLTVLQAVALCEVYGVSLRGLLRAAHRIGREL